jgi:hypothetical protein
MAEKSSAFCDEGTRYESIELGKPELPRSRSYVELRRARRSFGNLAWPWAFSVPRKSGFGKFDSLANELAWNPIKGKVDSEKAARFSID